jgi:multiple sugar transport system ATP-binding protein
MASVEFRSVTKTFDGLHAVDALDLAIADREFLVLLGPSGCGKSTALRMLAGLEDPTSGEVLIGERVVNDVAPKDRDIAMVFQSYALYPHKTVLANIEFPLKAAGVAKDERRQRSIAAAEVLGLGDLLDRKPGAMSGGQRQRVALARAIVREPSVFLMDEPLSNLDAKLRSETRAELTALHQRLQTTFVYVTHDQVEAMTMAGRIAIMNKGKLQQVGTPQQVYDRPANVFVAQFIGTPPMNLFPAGTLETGPHLVGVRPEHVHFDDLGTVEATIVLNEALGHEVHVTTRVGEAKIVARMPAGEPIPREGSSVRIVANERHRQRFDATTGEAMS